MRCPKLFFWRPCSWPGKLWPFRWCFSSNEYCIASCFMWASQANNLDIPTNIIWNQLGMQKFGMFFAIQPLKPWLFWHKNRPLNTAFNPNSIQNQSEATAKKRLTDTPYLLAGIVSKNRVRNTRFRCCLELNNSQNSSFQGFLFGGPGIMDAFRNVASHPALNSKSAMLIFEHNELFVL